ncbi:MAG TPA: protein kinase [Polyangiaceae bacterium]|nr:protein kinase [Polyangiaceae bacterium]
MEAVPSDAGAGALVGTLLAERYQVERFLGAGGMGEVYLAKHVLMQKPVAIKVLHREMTAHGEVVQRFEREAVAAGRIDHPNVAAASDFGRLPDGSFYLVLEYVAGRSLRDLIDAGPLPFERALGIGEQVTLALVAAHAAGIVHRDLKPDNVMLVENADGKDHVKVLDFGIAKLDEPRAESGEGKALTRIGAVMGTPGYMAPEQALGQAVDARADLYALGVLLYEMVAGRQPFEAEELAQIVAKQLTEAPAPLPAGVPPWFSALVTDLLAKTAAERPASASEVLDRLRGEGAARAAAAGSVTGLEPAVSARTVLVPMESSEKGFPWVLAGLAVLAGGGLALYAWLSPGAAPTPAGSADIVASAAPSAPTTPSAASAVASVRPPSTGAPPPTSTSHTETSVSETKTKSPDGRTTTTRTTKRTTTVEQRSEKKTVKRKTGPGGIYIPPPSQWFK